MKLLYRLTSPRIGIALAIVSALAIVASLIACSEKPPVIIGFAASLSGKDYMLGVEGRNAAELFIKEINASGGVAGRKLELVVRDFRSDDATVVPVSRELMDSGASLIVGYYTSAAAIAALSIPGPTDVPLISPAATSGALTGKQDAFFRTIMSSDDDIHHLAADMKSRGFKRVLFLAASWNKPYVDTYAFPLHQYVEVVADIRFDAIDSIDFGAIRLLKGNPQKRYDAVCIVASSLDSGTIAQELSIRGLSAPLYVSGWAGNDDLVVYGGSAVEGAVFVHQTDQANPGIVAMAEQYRDAFKVDPSFSAIQTWDAMLLAYSAIEKAGGVPGAISGALRSIRSFEGLAGPITLDEYGDAQRALYLKRVSGNRIITEGKVE
jgi:branched-chain amino acid transport system substrate-binding protein